MSVGGDAELIQLPRFHRPSLTPSELLSVLDFCRFGDGAVLRRQLDQFGGSVNTNIGVCMFNYVCLGTSDLEAAIELYDAMLPPLGLERCVTEATPDWQGWAG
jgi:hypothetical protein